jgi:hypothetical protein
VLTVTAIRIIRPPIVGVPFFFMCVSGPQSRIGWPSPCLARSQRMMRGPNTKQINSAVTKAPIVRNVM